MNGSKEDALDLWSRRVQVKSFPGMTLESLHTLQDEVALEMESEGWDMEWYKMFIGFVRFSKYEDTKYL